MRETRAAASEGTARTSFAPKRAARALSVVAVLVGTLIPMAGASNAAAKPQVEPEVPATAMNIGLGPANNSPLLVADPRQSRFVVLANRLDAPDFSCALQVSDDGGRAWISANPVPRLPAGADKCYAPEAAFDRDGVLYYLFVGLRGRGNEPMGAFLTTSTDHAQHFSKPRRILGPSNFGVRMGIDRASGAKGRIQLVWLHSNSDPGSGGFTAPANPIMAAHSDDGGRTFSKPLQVSDPRSRFVVAPALALGPDNAVHVAYYDLQDDARDYYGLEGPAWEGTWSLVLSSSSDGGERFSRGVVVDDRIRPSRRVMLIFTMPPASLVAGFGRLCAAWTDARRGDDDALARCSKDNGRSWSGLRRLNDDAVGNGRSQYLPRLSLSPDGRIDAIFLDRRRDPSNIVNDVHYTYSSDGGETFTRNLRLNRYGSDSGIGQQYLNRSAKGQVEIGSRLGLLSRETSVLAAWPDTHNSNSVTKEQDIFATEVSSLPASGGVSVTALLMGLVLTAVLIAVGVAWWQIRRRRRQPALEAHQG